MIFIGIDPGVNGGIAVLSGSEVRAHKMPGTDHGILRVLRSEKAAGEGPCVAVIEQVNSGVFGHQGRMGVRSAFTFGGIYRALKMSLAAEDIPYGEVRPAVWQHALQCRTGGDKNVTKRKAQELFPGVKVTHAIADALLLAEYCRRLKHG